MPPRGPLQLTIDDARRFLELLERAEIASDVAAKLTLALSDDAAEHVMIVIKVRAVEERI